MLNSAQQILYQCSNNSEQSNGHAYARRRTTVITRTLLLQQEFETIDRPLNSPGMNDIEHDYTLDISMTP